jgi:hypothetical protein
MQTQPVIALLAILATVAPELNAAEVRRPRATTITVVGSDTPAESESTAAANESKPREKLLSKTSSLRVPNDRTRIEFLVPDRSMEAWIVPAKLAAEASEAVSAQPALQTADRETQAYSSLSVVNVKPPLGVTEPAPEPRRPASRLALKLAPAAPPLQTSPPMTVASVEAPSIQVPVTIKAVPMPLRIQSQQPIERTNVVAQDTSAPRIQAPAPATNKSRDEETADVEIVKSNRPIPTSIAAAIGPQEPPAPMVRISATPDVKPTHVAPLPPPSQARPVEPLAKQPASAPVEETREVAAESAPPKQTTPSPRRFPAPVAYRAPDVAPSPNRGYFVPQSPATPFGGHGRQPGGSPERTARAPGNRQL